VAKRPEARTACAAAAALLLGALLGAAPAAAVPGPRALPAPYDVLGTDHLGTPVLDAPPPCAPASEADDGPVAAALRRGDPEAAARLAQETASARGAAGAASAAAAARTAGDRDGWRAAHAALRTAARAAAREGSPWAACASLELARLELLLGRHPEAAARVAAAAGLPGAEAPAASASRAWWEAETFYRSGRPFEAAVRLRRLARSDTPRIAAAARLRLADVRFDRGRAESVLREYQALLPRAEEFGARLQGWALRAAEAAFDSGDLEEAESWTERWLEGTDPGEDRALREPVRLRRADLRALAGDAKPAREILRELRARHEDGPMRALADARRVDLGLVGGEGAERVAALADAVRAPHRGARRYALGVLLHELVAAGDLEAAVAVATRLAWEGEGVALAPRFPEDLTRLLRSLAAGLSEGDPAAAPEAACRRLVRRLGGRYGILIQRASEAGAFLALARCYEGLGLPTLALSVYRDAVRAFGGAVADAVALPRARASLAAGDTAAARVAAEVALRDAAAVGPELGDWELLLAAAELREGRPGPAAERLRRLARGPRTPSDPVGLALWLARSLRASGDATAADRALLERTLETLPSALRDRRPLETGEAALVAGDLARTAGERLRARRLYERAARSLPEGPLRAEAWYRAGSVSDDRAAALEAFRRAAEGSDTGLWGRLARLEHDLAPLWRYGEAP